MGTTNVHGRGTLEGDETYPRGDEEDGLERKSAKAIRLLREYCHGNALQHLQPLKTELYKIALTSISFNQTD